MEGSNVSRNEGKSRSIDDSIARALIVKEGDLFFLSDRDGMVPLGLQHGLGLYYHDCRFLSGYVWSVSVAEQDAAGKQPVETRWTRRLSEERLALCDTFHFQNKTRQQARLFLNFTFRADFEDVFTVRGFVHAARGVIQPPAWEAGVLRFVYHGRDLVRRTVSVHFSEQLATTREAGAHFDLEFAPEQARELRVAIFLAENAANSDDRPHEPLNRRSAVRRRKGRPPARTEMQTDYPLLNRVLERSLRDLELLRSQRDGLTYFAAGVPWYVALFGRDSIIAALQTLAYDVTTAEETIRLLARDQGKEIDRAREEEPGKILHELRVGELAHLREIPHWPYYGTIDATPLWLVLLARQAAWTGDLRLFQELRPQVDAALAWMRDFGDRNGDGYLEYESQNAKGLANQGWKDSDAAIMNADGSLALPPVALVEVQAYAYEARIGIARLFSLAGERARAASLEAEGRQLRENFNRDFPTAEGYFALALQKGKRRAAVLSSNCGHALWSGIAEGHFARETARQLLSPQMFSGWGIRTLSNSVAGYDPFGYHVGSIWPHDNSLLAGGFKRYGLDNAALRILSGMVEAAGHFEEERLPELFGGSAREGGRGPGVCPVACRPQAWAAGTVPYLLTMNLGLEPDAFSKKLTIVRPHLPREVKVAEVRGLRVGAARVDLYFERRTTGEFEVRVGKLEGELEVEVRH